MTKADYLNSNDVQDFISWLVADLTSEKFKHSYILRQSKRNWSCDSLYDAYKKYEWGFSAVEELGIEAGSTFEENSRALARLQQKLRASLVQKDNVATCNASIAIVKWGGVANGNMIWLKKNLEGLSEYLNQVRDRFNQQDISHLPKDLRFNAGMTKIYSLACDELIIYDSRVAAALGWLVATFCEETERSVVPDNLNFPWAPAKEGADAVNPKNRCPNINNLKFQRLYSSQRPLQHAIWNGRASWLLAEVLDAAQKNQKNPFADDGLSSSEQLRAFEAALFMIGYDLGGGKA